MPTSSRPRSTLTVAITARGVLLNTALQDSTDRQVRFAVARFGPAVRTIRVVFSQLPGDLPMCTIRVALWPSSALIVRHHAGTLELALRGALRQAGVEIARELHDRAKDRRRRSLRPAAN